MLTLKQDDPDVEWFRQFPDRQAHVRMPRLELIKVKQRAVRYESECEAQFQTLGEHAASQRRIILWKVPPGNRWYDAKGRELVKIPFLAFADETIADEDAVLLPIVAEIMGNALREMQGVVEQDGL